ncbi:MAG: aldehyde dehydrogenase, partial [Myxococcota bacterium]|nr:aldehyde dehydrogenase [Myxococcota bacterium]
MSRPEAIQATRSPIDGSIYVERPLLDTSAVLGVLERHTAAGEDWKRESLAGRIQAVEAFLDALVAQREEIADELTWQMGRPISHSPH